MKKKLLASLLAFAMLFSLVPATAYAEDGYKAEITFIREDTNQTVTKTFTDPEEKLGFNDMATNDGGVYFMGWSPNQQLTVEQDELYFANEKVGEIFPNGTTEPATLYAQHANIFWAAILAKDHSIGINEILSAEETLPRTEIKSAEGNTITAYYDHQKDPGHELKLLANFKFNPMAAYYAYLNPHAMVRSYDDFDEIKDDTMKEKLPKFTHVDLHVKLDKRIKLADSVNVAFSSTTFVPLAYEKDGDLYDLLARISHEENSKKQKVTTTNVPTASYETAGEGANELMLRTGIRRHWKGYYVIPDLKASEVKEDMTLSTPDTGAFTILKKNAKAIADGDAEAIEVGGYVDGYVVGPSYHGLSLSSEIDSINASPLKISFVHPEVTFIPQTPGKTGEANIVNKIVGGTSHNFKEDGITNPEFPKVEPSEVAVDGATYLFKGWNTQKDGKGDWFTADTDVCKDMTVHAIWEKKPEPKPDTGHQGGSKGGATTTPSKPEPKPEKPSEGNLNKDDHYQYLIGYPDGTFAPNKGMTRAEVATMFTRLLKDRPVKGQTYAAGLSDIYAGDWYANTVGYAVQKGIVSGYPDGTFKPNQAITRAEFSSIASRFAELTEEKDLTFSDLDASHWGYKAIRLAASNGWISGYPDNTFRPEQAITRAEVTSITNRMLNRYADLDWINAHNDAVIHFSDVSAGDWFFEPVMEATMGHDFTRDKDGKAEKWTGLNDKTFI